MAETCISVYAVGFFDCAAYAKDLTFPFFAFCRHIEGKSGVPNLLSIPDDLLSNMRSLAFLHLGSHPHLSKLPSFKGLSNVKRIMLAYLFGITEMPSLASLKKLERLDVVYLPALPGIADLDALPSLRVFTLFRPNQMCCNGFIGACDLSHPYCTADAASHIPPVKCVQEDERASAATLQVIQANAATVCQNPTLIIPEEPTKESVDMCAGIPFRQCQRSSGVVDGTETLETGICFNTRMQVLACTLEPFKTQIRQQQILHNVGPVCDPAVEAWLGCASK